MVWVDYDTGIAIHRVRPGVSQSQRLSNLATDDPNNKRMSLGCVVVPEAFFLAVVLPTLGHGRGTVYVLPEDEPVHVNVSTTPAEAVVRVIDHGPGVTVEEREHIFEPFHRGNPGDRPGAGLGLAIARGFAEANGGRLWAQDDPAGGHLVLSLPLAERPAAVKT